LSLAIRLPEEEEGEEEEKGKVEHWRFRKLETGD
jgi:hypothetical protein